MLMAYIYIILFTGTFHQSNILLYMHDNSVIITLYNLLVLR